MANRPFTKNFHGSGSLFCAENRPLFSNFNSSKTDERAADFSGFRACCRDVRSKSVMRNLDNALAARGSLNPLMIVREFQGSLEPHAPEARTTFAAVRGNDPCPAGMCPQRAKNHTARPVLTCRIDCGRIRSARSSHRSRCRLVHCRSACSKPQSCLSIHRMTRPGLVTCW